MRSVCYVLAEYPVLSQTFVHAELVALRAAGVQVGVVAHRAGPEDLRFGDGPDGVPLPLALEGLDNPALNEVLSKYDHLHGHFADFGVRTLEPLAKAAGRPFSFTAHAYDLFRRDAAVLPEEWRQTQARVVTISQFHAAFISSRGFPADRISVIPNAARLRPLLARGVPAPRKLRHVLAVGRPTAKKGFGVLVAGWRQARNAIHDLRLTIVGGEGMCEPEEGLSLLGLMPYSEVLDIMADADLIAAPSVVADNGDMDGIPTVLAEAGALCRPVVATELSGIGDLVVPGVNGFLCPPGDAAALAAVMIRLALRPDEMQRMGRAGPRLAAAHDAEVVAGRLVAEVFH
jgi:glycosyltransferase involved in cell wall biosynthesis